LRAEDKQVDGIELERAERETESELEKEDDEELGELVVEEKRDLARTEQGALLEAVRAIFARDYVVVSALRLPHHELRALDALKAAVDGRDGALHQFVYAADRRELLEQALAVLQPNLAYDDRQYAALVAHVSELRHELTSLEDAQDELLEHHEVAAVKTDAKPPPEDDQPEVDPDAPKASTLYGAEVAAPAKPGTSLGDAAEIAAAQKDAIPKSRVEPEQAGAVEPAAEAAAADAPKKKPWWKRPFG
jgi:hypothetical protein